MTTRIKSWLFTDISVARVWLLLLFVGWSLLVLGRVLEWVFT